MDVVKGILNFFGAVGMVIVTAAYSGWVGKATIQHKTLQWVNGVRAASGAVVLQELPGGQPRSTANCPVAKAFSDIARVEVDWLHLSYTRFTLVNSAKVIRHKLPFYVTTFVVMFDAVQYRDLVGPGDPISFYYATEGMEAASAASPLLSISAQSRILNM